MVNFHEDAITESCRQALAFLQGLPLLDHYYLAGGTALALQIGHRVSTDLDWFTAVNQLGEGERETFRSILSAGQSFAVTSEQDGMLFTRLFGTDVSFIFQQHPLLEATVAYRGFQLAAPMDIGLMKLAAINSRGTRRDFVDLYCMRDLASLEEILARVPFKYANRPSFLAIAARALAYFEDAESQPMPRMHVNIRWRDVRAYCEDAALKLSRQLSGLI